MRIFREMAELAHVLTHLSKELKLERSDYPKYVLLFLPVFKMENTSFISMQRTRINYLLLNKKSRNSNIC